MTKDKLYELFGFSVHPEIPSDGTENSFTQPAADTGEGYSFYEVVSNSPSVNPFEYIEKATDGEHLVHNQGEGKFYVAAKGACYVGTKIF